MKKTAIIALFLCAAMLLSFPAAAEEVYSFGSGEMFKEADWGKDGFTFQFAQMYNTGGEYDVSKFQDCVWGNSSAYAMYMNDSGRKMWCPSIRATETGKFKGDTMWWIVSNENGSIMPSNGLLAILKWTAPKDGKYTVNTKLLAGVSQAYEDHQAEYGPFDMNDDMDGVTCSIYHDSKKLYSQNSGQVFYTESKMNVPKLELEMHKGEALYFIADQNKDSDYDDSRWTISIAKTGDLPTAATKAPASTTTKPSAGTSAASVNNTTKAEASAAETEAASQDTSTDATEASADPEVSENVSGTSADVTTPTTAENTEAGGEPAQSNAWLIAVIAAVAVIAAAVVVVVVLKKKKSA